MAVTLTNTPERTDFGVTSRFVAVGNPTPFNWQFSFSGSFTASSFGVLDGRVFANVASIPSNVQVSDFVKLERTSDGADIFTTVTSIDSVNLRIFFNLSVNEGYSSIIENWLPNDYYLQIRIEVEGVQVDVSKVDAFTDGTIFFDPSQFLENELLNEDSFDYVTAQAQDLNASKNFILYYQEFFRGQLQGSEEQTEEFRAINAAKQVQQQYGVNLLDKLFLPTQTKILSCFDEPKVWAGYPFDLQILTEQGLSSNELETPQGTITLDQGLFNKVNRIAFDTSNLNNIDGCIESGTTTPPVNSFIWVNDVCEVLPTVTEPPTVFTPPIPPAPEPEQPPAFCNERLGSQGGSNGVFDYSYVINFTGFFAILFEPYTFTDKAELGKLQSDNLTVDILATTHMVNTDPSLNIDPNSGLSTLGSDINIIPFDNDGRRFLGGDAAGSGVAAGGCDAIDQYIGLAKLNPASGSGCTPQADYPRRLNEYIAATGDQNPPQIFGSGLQQYVWLDVSPGDIVVIRVSGRSGTLWNIPNIFCYQT